ncbi:MAG: cation:proton antiporter [Longimicrobiales bacterium]|nr:cation:proton antiporter [Longimicrobiales bacterium]
MDPLVAALVLILLALVGARVSFSTERVPVGPRLLFRTGTHFLFIGFVLGPPVLALVSRDALSQLFPLIGLGLGWVGMLFGLQMDRSSLMQFPRRFPIVATGQALLTFLLVFATGTAVAGAFDALDRPLLMGIAVAAAIASVSTPAGIAIVAQAFPRQRPIVQLLLFIAAVDGIIGIVALDITYAVFHDVTRSSGGEATPWWFWAMVSVGLGIVCAVVFLWLARLRPTREELVLYLLGISALSAGAALQLQLSPLFVGMVLGAIVVNLSPDGDRIFAVMERWEKPIYVVLLLLAGALLRFPTWWIIPVAIAFAAVRATAKVVAGAVMVRAAKLPRDTPRLLGMGLMSQGGISLAMVLSAVLTLAPRGLEIAGYPAVDLLFSTVVLSVVLSELAGPLLVATLLGRAEEGGSPPAPPPRTGAPTQGARRESP